MPTNHGAVGCISHDEKDASVAKLMRRMGLDETHVGKGMGIAVVKCTLLNGGASIVELILNQRKVKMMLSVVLPS